ncbi:MAG: DNA polymerase IV [Myxococcota bacterium]|jgi:DNA polymerase-4|nr:DNA polymerase IV [Myxococcota bacterium]
MSDATATAGKTFPHVIMHADMDAFYASVEQRDNPELRGKPIAVGGESARGVVSAASYEARVFGVRSAMPAFEARRLCPDLIFVRGNMALYAKESRRIFAIFDDFSPRVEGLSLDEAFLDLTGSERLMGLPREVATRLRARVREEVGLAVSCGIGPVKMVAKIASAAAKPDGLCEVLPGEVRAFLAPLSVRAIWGVGPVGAKRLGAAGFETLGELAEASAETVRLRLGAWGSEIARLARGEDIREVEAYREAKSYSEENTFASDIRDREVLQATILTHAESVARRLRRDDIKARVVVLKWSPAERRAPGPRGYASLSRQTTLFEATDDGEVLAREARKLLARAPIEGAVRLIGVGAEGLEPAEAPQMSLFEDAPEKKRRSELNRALDEITDRFGSKALRRASQGGAERAGLSMQIKRGERLEEEGGP